MDKDTFRVVTRGADGQIRIRDYDNQEALLKRHSQVGVDDCSTDLGLRGQPVFSRADRPDARRPERHPLRIARGFRDLDEGLECGKPARRRSRARSPVS